MSYWQHWLKFKRGFKHRSKNERISFWITMALFLLPPVVVTAIWGAAGFFIYLGIMYVIGGIGDGSTSPRKKRKKRLHFRLFRFRHIRYY